MSGYVERRTRVHNAEALAMMTLESDREKFLAAVSQLWRQHVERVYEECEKAWRDLEASSGQKRGSSVSAESAQERARLETLDAIATNLRILTEIAELHESVLARREQLLAQLRALETQSSTVGTV